MLNLPPAKPKSGKVQASQARGQGRDKGREASTSPSQLELPGLGHSEPSGEGEGAVGEGEGAYPFGDDCLEPAVREREREGGTRAREASITTTGPSKRTARSSPRNPVDPQELPTSHAQHCHPPRLSCGGAPYPPAGLPSPLHPLPAMLSQWARPASSSGSDASGGSSGTGSGGATHPHPLSAAGGVRASPHAQAVLTGRQLLGSSSPQMCSAGGQQEAVTLMCPEPDDITSLSQLSSHIHAHQHQQHQHQQQHQQQRASLGATPNPAWPAGPNTYSLSARRSEPGSVGMVGCKHRLEEGQEGGGAVRKVGEAEAAAMAVCAWVEQNKGSSGGSKGKLDGGQAGSLLAPSAHQCVAGGEDSSGATEVCLSVQHMRLGPQQQGVGPQQQGVPWAVCGSLPRQESGSQPLPTAFRSTTLLTQQSQGLGQGQGQAWQRQPSLQSVLPDTPLAGLAPMQNVFAWPPALGRGARPDRHPSLGQGELHDGIMMSFSHTVMDSFLESMEHAGGDPMHTSLMQSGDFLMTSNASKYGYPTAMCTEGTWA
ncbi:hypothetical protein V8C86DRAFT_1574910 [Haematococcus lacustris]